jgi:hypothetical protein
MDSLKAMNALRLIYLAKKLMDLPRDVALHTIAHEIAQAFLTHQGNSHHQWCGGYDAEVEADALVAAWEFPEPPGRAEEREQYR